VTLLDGMRILVVEDEALIAIDIEAQLRLLGGVVVGPEGRLDRALELAETVPLDGALLDINIRGGVVFPVAEVLLARGVPVLLSTGFGPERLPAPFRALPYLRKPFDARQLQHAVLKAFVGPRPASRANGGEELMRGHRS
jgi:CheY-like chemotaxis protein